MNRPSVLAALALAGALAASAASAQSFYVAAAGGRSNASIDCAGTTSCNRDANAFKLVGGWNLNDGLAAELTYYALGTSRFSAGGVGVDVTGSYVGLGLAGHMDFGPNVGAVIRGGWADGSSTVTGTVPGMGSVSSSRSGTNHWYAGAGVVAILTRQWRVEFDYDRTRTAIGFGAVKSTHDVGAFMVGGIYSF
jgi:hypothetical protein